MRKTISNREPAEDADTSMKQRSSSMFMDTNEISIYQDLGKSTMYPSNILTRIAEEEEEEAAVKKTKIQRYELIDNND